MLSLDPELGELRRAGLIDEATAAREISLERRALFSVFAELRIALYAGLVAITTGLGMLLKSNLDRIGPLALVVALAAFAAVCYAIALRWRAKRGATLGGEYVVLLAALTVSAALGYGESQFHWLGDHWSLHLLLLALVHGITAYVFDSPLVLSLALATVASWLGIERNVSIDFGWRAFIFGAGVLAWREIHRRRHGDLAMQAVLEQFCSNSLFLGAVTWCANSERPLSGLLIVAMLAVVSIRAGLKSGREAFVAYGVVYATLAACLMEAKARVSLVSAVALMLGTLVAAAILFWKLRTQLRSAA
jgi:hypothetical protein